MAESAPVADAGARQSRRPVVASSAGAATGQTVRDRSDAGHGNFWQPYQREPYRSPWNGILVELSYCPLNRQNGGASA
jgi:hypothetical protein